MASDEVERLRADVTALRRQLTDETEVGQLVAEERDRAERALADARAALLEIAEHYEGEGYPEHKCALLARRTLGRRDDAGGCTCGAGIPGTLGHLPTCHARDTKKAGDMTKNPGDGPRRKYVCATNSHAPDCPGYPTCDRDGARGAPLAIHSAVQELAKPEDFIHDKCVHSFLYPLPPVGRYICRKCGIEMDAKVARAAPPAAEDE